MRNNNHASGGASGAGGLMILIPIVFVCGVLAVIAATRAEVFKPQPTQAVVSVAYATRARIENDAERDRLAADLAHTKEVQKITQETLQTAKDLLIVAGGIGCIYLLAMVGTRARVMAGRMGLNMRLVNPNRQGLFPISMDGQGRVTNPNMLTAPWFDPEHIDQLPPELQLEAFAWMRREGIANALGRTKTFTVTANQERGLIRATAIPAAPKPGQSAPRLPAYDATAIVSDVEYEPQGFITDNGQTQPVSQGGGQGQGFGQPQPPAVQPGPDFMADMTEKEFYDNLKRNRS